MEALELYNKAIFNSYAPSQQINYSYMGENEQLFYKFDAANFALLNDHAITTHQRKFFFDKINNQFHPIYYDGNSNFLELGHIRWRGDYLENKKLFSAAAELYDEINIDDKSFNEKLNNRGINISKTESDILISKFLNNLKNISEQTSDITPEYKDFLENNKSIFYLMDLTFFYNFKNDNYEICKTDLSNCLLGNNYIDIDEIFSKKVKAENLSSYLVGTSKKSFLENSEMTMNIIEIDKNLFIRFYGKPNISIDKNNKEIALSFISKFDRVVIEGGGIFNDWQVNLSSNLVDVNIETTYDENLLTGCLTLNHMYFENLSINAENMFCEDAVNIINSNGSLKNIYINKSKHDGLDIDFSNIDLNNLSITNSSNDCLDLSSGNYTIKSINLDTCFDKGLSVGEKSYVNINNNIEIKNSEIAIAVKDSSKVFIENFAESNNNFACYNTERNKNLDLVLQKLKNLNAIQKLVSKKGRYLKINNYRKELKLCLSNGELYDLMNFYQPKLEKLYSQRKITSRYFDTNDYKLFRDSINYDVDKFKSQI